MKLCQDAQKENVSHGTDWKRKAKKVFNFLFLDELDISTCPFTLTAHSFFILFFTVAIYIFIFILFYIFLDILKPGYIYINVFGQQFEKPADQVTKWHFIFFIVLTFQRGREGANYLLKNIYNWIILKGNDHNLCFLPIIFFYQSISMKVYASCFLFF